MIEIQNAMRSNGRINAVVIVNGRAVDCSWEDATPAGGPITCDGKVCVETDDADLRATVEFYDRDDCEPIYSLVEQSLTEQAA